MVNLNLGPPAPAPVAQAPQKMEVGQDTHITVKPAKFASRFGVIVFGVRFAMIVCATFVSKSQVQGCAHPVVGSIVNGSFIRNGDNHGRVPAL